MMRTSGHLRAAAAAAVQQHRCGQAGPPRQGRRPRTHSCGLGQGLRDAFRVTHSCIPRPFLLQEPPPELAEVLRQVQAAIDELGGRVVPKFSWSCPKVRTACKGCAG